MAVTTKKTNTTSRKATNAKTSSTAIDEAAVAESSAASVVEEVVSTNDIEKKSNKNSKIVEKELLGTDEIEVIALISNVEYYDNATGDRYIWENVGDVEFMTVDALTRMRRNHRGYLENMCVKPQDERVINKFGLARLYDKYDYLMDKDNYTRDNISDIISSFASMRSNGLKGSIIMKIKDMVRSGELSDINVIRTIEKNFDIDLIDSYMI